MLGKRGTVVFKRGTAILMACALLFSIVAPPFAQARQTNPLEHFDLREKLKTSQYNPALAQAIIERTPLPLRSQIKQNLLQNKNWGQTPNPILNAVWGLSPILNYFQAHRGRIMVAVVTIGVNEIYRMVTGHGLHLELVAAMANVIPLPVPDPISPKPEVVRKSLTAFTYEDLTQDFRGIDWEHYVVAQRKLSREKTNSDRYTELVAQDSFTKAFIDSVNGNMYQDPRLALDIVGQNKNPRAQGVYEAVANSLDALGLNIGQFGRGVKQIAWWLESTGVDRVDVWTKKKGEPAYHLAILKDKQGQYYIQPPKEIEEKEFYKAAGKELASGTVVKVTTPNNKIPQTEQKLTQDRRNSQEGMEEGIHKRFPFVTKVKITTQREGGNLKEVNGFKEKRVIVGSEHHSRDLRKDASIHVHFTDHALTILDNGEGMDAERITKMFVPKEGSKNPEPLTQEQIQTELKNMMVVQDPTLPHRVSFSRNGEVVVAIDIPESVPESATSVGGLMVEFGALMDVPESRDALIIPLDLAPGHRSNFELAVEHAVEQIIHHPELSPEEKLKFINTIVVGLDGLTRGNQNYAHILKTVRAHIQKSIAPLVEELRIEGTLFLPNDKQFEQIQIPEGKKVFYLHENLFQWKGAINLKEIGGSRVPGITLRGDKEIPLIVIPFKLGILKYILKFYPFWHRLPRTERIPILRNDRFIAIPEEVGKRFLELSLKRIEPEGLTKKEQKEFLSLKQRVNIYTAQEVSTQKEGPKVKENIRVADVSEIAKSEGEIDSDAINKFLAKPPISTPQIEPQRAPNDANMKYALLESGELVEIGTGRKVEFNTGGEVSNIESLEYLSRELYKVIHMGMIKIFEISNGVVSIITKGDDIVISPNKKFIFGGNANQLRISEDSRIASYPLSHFSENPTQVGTLNYSHVRFSPDGRYLTYCESGIGLKNFVAVDLERIRVIKRIPLGLGEYNYTNHTSKNNLVLLTEDLNAIPSNYLIDLEDNHIDRFVKISDIDLRALKVSQHPHFDLIIDNSNPNHPIATDPKTGKKFEFKGDILHYSDSEILTLLEDGFLKRKFHDSNGNQHEVIQSKVKGIVDKIPSNFVVENYLNEPFFFTDHKNSQPLMELNIPKDYTSVTFDGKYFVFINPKNGDAVYLNPEDPENPVFVPMSGSAEALGESLGTVPNELLLQETKPADAPSKFVIVPNADGTFSLVPAETASALQSQTTSEPQSKIYIPGSQLKKLIMDVTHGVKYYVETKSDPRFTLTVTLTYIDGYYDIEVSELGSGYNFFLGQIEANDPITFLDKIETLLNEEMPRFCTWSKINLSMEREQILRKMDGMSSHGNLVVISKTEQGLPSAQKWKWIERMNDEVFIAYDKLGGFAIVKTLKSGEIETLLESQREREDSILDHTDKLIILENKDFEIIENEANEAGVSIEHYIEQFVLDINTEKLFPDTMNSEAVHLSASGRFSVHLTPNGRIEYYDHDQLNPSPKFIGAIPNPNDNHYRVHDRTDAVLFNNFNGTYNLFSLTLGKMIIENAAHIEIDSSGKVAVIKNGYLLNVINLLNGKPLTDQTIVKISSDDQFVYLMIRGSGSHLLVNKYNKDTLSLIGTTDINDPLLPRFWESYHLEKKTIWDRKTNKTDDEIFPYGNNRPTDPYISTLLLGQNIIRDEKSEINRANPYIPQRRISSRNLENGEQRAILVLEDKAKLNFLKDNLVGYIESDNGSIQKDYLPVNPAGYYFADLIFINKSKTFLILKPNKNGRSFLMNKYGNIIDMPTHLLEGFEPIDVNGDYFVFYNAKMGKILYVDPSKIESGDSQKEAPQEEVSEEFLQVWNDSLLKEDKKGVSRRKAYIAQAQAGYHPLLALVPEEYQSEIENHLSRGIGELYGELESKVKERFSKVMEEKSDSDSVQELVKKVTESLKAPGLRLNSFSRKMEILNAALPQYLESMQPLVSQETPEFQKNFYRNIFVQLFELALNGEIDLEKLGAAPSFVALYQSLGLGYKITTQEELKDLETVSEFSNLLVQHASLWETQRLFNFLSKVSGQDPSNHAIIIGQMKRFLEIKGNTSMISRFATAFKKVNNDALELYLQDNLTHPLGDAREFLIFLTHKVDPVKFKKRWTPKGTLVEMPQDGIDLPVIMALEEDRPKAAEGKSLMSLDYFEEKIGTASNLPKAPQSLVVQMRQDIDQQSAPGLHAREGAQNTLDALHGRKGELEVDYYLQENKGTKELVEEFKDDGPGPEEEMALLIRKSPKAEDLQNFLTGYFGRGKYTYFNGADRVEMIMKNRLGRAVMFTLEIDRNNANKVITVRLTEYRKITDPKVKQGLTVRRIKKAESTIPELEQMLGQAAWKTFDGLAQSDNFTIYFVDHEGVRHPLTVEKEILSESVFSAVHPETKKTKYFGNLRIIAAKDLQPHIIDKAGLWVSDMKPEYLELIPEPLRAFVEELGITIQIPLPQIGNRTDFEHENDYLPAIQKFVAIEFYKALAYKALTQKSPQFVFGNFPQDWRTNANYWNSINLKDSTILSLAEKINKGSASEEFDEIDDYDLRSLLTEKDKEDKVSKYVKLILLLMVAKDPEKPEEKTSLLLERLAVQRAVDERVAEEQRDLLVGLGFNLAELKDLPDLREDPRFTRWTEETQFNLSILSQMTNLEAYILEPENYAEEEEELKALALEIGQNFFGIEQVMLVQNEFLAPIAFGIHEGKNTMYVHRSLANHSIDQVTDTILHHIAHMLEKRMAYDELEEYEAHNPLDEKGVFFHLTEFTHDSVGIFAEAMKYGAGISLTGHKDTISSIAIGLLAAGLFFAGSAQASILTGTLSGTDLFPAFLIALGSLGYLFARHREPSPVQEYQNNFDLFEEEAKSSVYKFSNKISNELLQNSISEQNGIIFVHLEDKLLGKKGDKLYPPRALNHILHGIVKSIEETESKNPEKKIYISFVYPSDQMAKTVSKLIEKYQLQDYILPDFSAVHSPANAYAQSKERNLSIAFVVTPQPKEWIPYGVNWIKLMGGEEVTVYLNGEERLLKKEEQPNLEELKTLWKERETIDLAA